MIQSWRSGPPLAVFRHQHAHLDLQATLTEPDSDTATKLERLVRDAMALVRPANKMRASEVDANTLPPGYFERTYGCLSDHEIEAPADPPAEHLEEW